MKTRNDPRHQKRRELLTFLFSYGFNKDQPLDQFSENIIKNFPFVDEKITKAAPEWPLERINRIDLSILRLAIFELCIQKTEPPKVIIDEAVELAKEFGSENSPSFVNGVLGNILNEIESNEKP